MPPPPTNMMAQFYQYVPLIMRRYIVGWITYNMTQTHRSYNVRVQNCEAKIPPCNMYRSSLLHPCSRVMAFQSLSSERHALDYRCRWTVLRYLGRHPGQ